MFGELLPLLVERPLSFVPALVGFVITVVSLPVYHAVAHTEGNATDQDTEVATVKPQRRRNPRAAAKSRSSTAKG